MKFDRIFFKSDDFVTAIDMFPLNRSLICCANYSGRIFLYDYEAKIQIVENRLKLQRRKSSTSDTDIIQIPHVSALAFSHDGHHLLCGLENGSVVTLDPNVLHELKTLHVSHEAIIAIKFSPDAFFVVVYVRQLFILSEICNNFLTARRMKNLPSFCYIMTSHFMTTVGQFWEVFVTTQNPFVTLYLFHQHRHHLRTSIKSHRDWFPWPRTE